MQNNSITPRDLVEIPCLRCGSIVSVLPEMMKHGVLCEDCIASENLAVNRVNHAKSLVAQWESICPKAYLDTQLDRLPYQPQSQRALRWPKVLSGSDREAPWIGLNLWGAPRTGKTRTLLLILKHRHFLGQRVRFIGPSEFAHECELRQWKTAPWIKKMSEIDLLAFDDLDKCKFTKTQEEKFFAVLDARVRSRKPIFFTGNTVGNELKQRFHNGDPIIGRIREFCVSIHFPMQQALL